jgi:hypothetical protein
MILFKGYDGTSIDQLCCCKDLKTHTSRFQSTRHRSTVPNGCVEMHLLHHTCFDLMLEVVKMMKILCFRSNCGSPHFTYIEISPVIRISYARTVYSLIEQKLIKLSGQYPAKRPFCPDMVTQYEYHKINKVQHQEKYGDGDRKRFCILRNSKRFSLDAEISNDNDHRCHELVHLIHGQRLDRYHRSD